MVSSAAPFPASRQCLIRTTVSATAWRPSLVASASYDATTLPASVFSTGNTPASASPALTAEATSSGVRVGTGSASGQIATTASSLYAPRSPGNATRRLAKGEHLLHDGIAHFASGAPAPTGRFDVRRRPSLAHDRSHGALDHLGLRLEIERVTQQQRDAQNCPQRICDPATSN